MRLHIAQYGRIVIIGIRTSPDVEEGKEEFNAGIFENLMRLSQKRQTEFFEINEIEDVKYEIFEFGIKPFQTCNFLHEIVIVFK
jgi:hypothetical protein